MCVLAASHCGLTSVTKCAEIRLAWLACLLLLGVSAVWANGEIFLSAGCLFWGSGEGHGGTCLCSCWQHWASLLMIWQRMWAWLHLRSSRIYCSCHCLFQHLPLPVRELCFCMVFCEREELCCRKSSSYWVFLFADDSKLKTQSRAVASFWSYCVPVFKSQVLQSHLRRHRSLLALAGSDCW